MEREAWTSPERKIPTLAIKPFGFAGGGHLSSDAAFWPTTAAAGEQA